MCSSCVLRPIHQTRLDVTWSACRGGKRRHALHAWHMEYAPATHIHRMHCMRNMSFSAVAICIVRHRLVQRLSAVPPLNALSSVPPCSSSRVPSVMYRSDRLLHRMLLVFLIPVLRVLIFLPFFLLSFPLRSNAYCRYRVVRYFE
jgi:hypothetical protein